MAERTTGSGGKAPRQRLRPLWRWLLAAGLILATALIVHMPKGLWQLIVLAGASLVWIVATGFLTGRGAKRFLLALGCCALAFFAFLTAMRLSQPRLDMQIPAVEREVYKGHNVLLLVPHQDDDVSILGGVIEAYAGASDIHIAFVTTGDNGADPAVRMREARAAAACMGVPADALILLGYGNDWSTPYGHLYHAPDGETVVSAQGFTATYGTPEYPPYRARAYTRANMRTDIEELILSLRPDTIFCVGFDNHPDHRAVSLLFEEAMGRVLRRESGYTPAVYKGFSYNTGFAAAKDFYAPNLRSTRLSPPVEHMPESPMYRWDARVRFPVADCAASRFLRRSTVAHALDAYRSQKSGHYKEFVVNGDKVFWQRDTGGLLYAAAVTASSGDAAALNDFRMEASDDIMNAYRPPHDGLWRPGADDSQKRAAVELPAPVRMDELRFYDNPSLSDNVRNLRVTLDDGTVLESGALRPDGTASVLRFEAREVSGFTVELTELEGAAAGLIELEAYGGHAPEGARWIKVTDEEGDFVYEYLQQNPGSLRLGLYESPAAAGEGPLAARYAVSVAEAGCEAALDGDAITVRCPMGSACTLTVRALDDPALTDVVRISNPRPLRRGLIACARWADWMCESLSWVYQSTYYGGIFRRLLARL